MEKLVLIDGNSILNRAFYGIIGSKMLMTSDGTYTNAIYGFLSILFKIIEENKPQYIAVAFDLKGPTKRHEKYEGYKANRKGMPQELADQMPIMKEILKAMNISIIEKQGYEGDDILGTLSVLGYKNNIEVTILSGDRDTFQLAKECVTIQIPRTKIGKTEVEYFNKQKVEEIYGLEPRQLIDVKGLMGDPSDNIPGVPGIGEKTALELIKQYESIENLYNKIEQGQDNLKGKTKEKIVENKELAILSKELGTIDTNVPLETTLEELKIQPWDNEKVYEIFKKLRFNRYIERFNLSSQNQEPEKPQIEIQEIQTKEKLEVIINKIKEENKMFYYLGKETSNNQELIIKEVAKNISICIENVVYYIDLKKFSIEELKEIFEDANIEKYGYKLKKDYILLKEQNITIKNIKYDIEIAAYILNPTKSKFEIEELAIEEMQFEIEEYLKENNSYSEESAQINLFESQQPTLPIRNILYAYCINQLVPITKEKLEQTNQLDLFSNIEMPTLEVLADMQYTGINVDKEELIKYGQKLQEKLDMLTNEIHELAGFKFNINSTKQLGEALFEKLQLPIYKKTKNGYSTDVDVLEKLKKEHPIVEKILEYRQYAKLNSTYVEGMVHYINPKTNRIHSYFHQTVTATGRISSTEPNLQNIPTKIELGKQLRKAFKPNEDCIFLDADYSQIELRILAHISEDEHMIQAFQHGEDIHAQAASKVFHIPLEEVTKQQRSEAKAVNFGIVYGISDFGLSEQLGVSKKVAKNYIEEYLEQYSGIKKFMDEIVEKAKQEGYVTTLFGRRRYVPELSSNNYMVRQFGARVAMNTPIQGTAADIMKIAMIEVYTKLKKEGLKAKIVLQIHDELLIETPIEEKEKVANILQTSMEKATQLKVPLNAEVSEANNWYEAK